MNSSQILTVLIVVCSLLCQCFTAPGPLGLVPGKRNVGLLQQIESERSLFLSEHIEQFNEQTNVLYEQLNITKHPKLQVSSPYRVKIEDVKFELFTRSNPMTPQLLIMGKDPIHAPAFSPYRETVMVIHGYLEDMNLASWMLELKEKYLEMGDVNVVLVQWSQLASKSYSDSAHSALQVGFFAGQILLQLEMFLHLSPANVHIIGFSLGAHAAGIAGQFVKGIGRITGLDPAGPIFETAAPKLRLDKSDAVFVDVIHTNLGTISNLHFGIQRTVGDIDFFVNGGEDQPGCSSIAVDFLAKILSGDYRDFHPCSHTRSYLYYIESMEQSQFRGYECHDYKLFQTGKCLTNQSAGMGYDVTGKQTGVYHVDTLKSYPYAGKELQLKISLGEVVDKTVGSLHFYIYPMDRASTNLPIEDSTMYHYRTNETLTAKTLVPANVHVAAIPMQIEFSRNVVLSDWKTLKVKEIIIWDTLSRKSYKSCNLSLETLTAKTLMLEKGDKC